MKNLISNTAFGKSLLTKHLSDKQVRDLRDNYDEFLSLLLEIWMFVPCKLVKGVWIFLEEPDADFYMMVTDEEIVDYQQAKERCLFEGLKFKDVQPSTEYNYFHLNGNKIFEANNQYKFNPCYGLRTIEDLVKYKPELTPNTQKQLAV